MGIHYQAKARWLCGSSKGQINGKRVDYFETFSHVAKLTSVRIMISIAINYN